MGQRTRCDGASEYSIGIGHRQWLRPRSARFRFARQDHSISATICW
jgi:hypothetical protein